MVKITEMNDIKTDEFFMNAAIKEARIALSKNEVPVGAVVTCQNSIIARAHNLCETLTDPTAHAEMQVITAAANSIGGKYLNECTLYVTLEPCVMCAGAIYWSQLGKLVYGARDLKRGFSLLDKNVFHPKTIIVSGILEKECSEIVSGFFEKLRLKNNL
ncbi:MAG: nucleoside deaminase [Bacteroidota bacterium]